MHTHVELHELAIGDADTQLVDGFLLRLTELHLGGVEARAVVAVVADEWTVADLSVCQVGVREE